MKCHGQLNIDLIRPKLLRRYVVKLLDILRQQVGTTSYRWQMC